MSFPAALAAAGITPTFWARLNDAVAVGTAANLGSVGTALTYRSPTYGQTAVGINGGTAIAQGGTGAIAQLASVPTALNANNVSVEIRVRIPSGGGMGAFFSIGNGANGWAVGIGGTNYGNSGTSIILLVGNVAFYDTGYHPAAGDHHIVAVRGAAGAISIYSDDVLQYTSAKSFLTASGTTDVGGIQTGNGISSGIVLDDYAAFPAALTSTQVHNHYTTGSSAILADSPSIFCKFDETTPVMIDSSGNGHNGTFTGNLTTGGANLVHDGTSVTSTTFVKGAGVVPSASWMQNGVVSMAARMKTTSTGGEILTRDFEAVGGGTLSRQWAFGFSGSNLSCEMWNNTNTYYLGTSSGVTLTTGVEYTVGLTLSGGVMSFYVDGVARGTGSYTGTVKASDNVDLQIGSRSTVVGPDMLAVPFVGSLQEVMFVAGTAWTATNHAAIHTAVTALTGQILSRGGLDVLEIPVPARQMSRDGLDVLLSPQMPMQLSRAGLDVLVAAPAQFVGWGFPLV